MFAALLSAIASGAGLIVDKVGLSRERISLRIFLPLVFIFLCAYSLLLTPLLGRVNLEVALLPNSLFLLFLMVLTALASNVLFYQSVQKDKVHDHELIAMTGPLVTVLLAAVFFPEEFNLKIFGLAIIASLALIFAKSEKAHFKPSKTSLNLFLAIILIATESIIIRELLYSYTPVALYAVRTFFLAIFFMAYYNPKYKQVSAKHWWLIAGSSFLGLIAMVGKFYAFESIGVIHATLITAIAPLIVFLASWEILHERIRARAVIAAIVIMVAVSWASVISSQ